MSNKLKLAERAAQNILNDNGLPSGEKEWLADMETAFALGWEAAVKRVREAVKDADDENAESWAA